VNRHKDAYIAHTAAAAIVFAFARGQQLSTTVRGLFISSINRLIKTCPC